MRAYILCVATVLMLPLMVAAIRPARVKQGMRTCTIYKNTHFLGKIYKRIVVLGCAIKHFYSNLYFHKCFFPLTLTHTHTNSGGKVHSTQICPICPILDIDSHRIHCKIRAYLCYYSHIRHSICCSR